MEYFVVACIEESACWCL